jgi:hypothetical protein
MIRVGRYSQASHFLRWVPHIKEALSLGSMTNLYIVTGASQNHFKSLKQFLSSTTASAAPRIACYVWDLGLDSSSVEELKNTFHITMRTFDYSKYPDYFNIQVNAGEYAWKPTLIYETMKELIAEPGEKVLCWCDAGHFYRPETTKYIVSIATRCKLYSPVSSGYIRTWTHPKTLEYFGISSDDSRLNHPNRAGGQIGFLISDPDVQKFVKEFADCAKIKECIAPEGSSRANHRQDQAVLTILYYRFIESHPECLPIGTYVCDIHRDID